MIDNYCGILRMIENVVYLFIIPTKPTVIASLMKSLSFSHECYDRRRGESWSDIVEPQTREAGTQRVKAWRCDGHFSDSRTWNFYCAKGAQLRAGCVFISGQKRRNITPNAPPPRPGTRPAMIVGKAAIQSQAHVSNSSINAAFFKFV